MTAKQQIATGFLAALIVCSVAFMPASADSSHMAARSAPKPEEPVVETRTRTNTNTAQAPIEAPRDLTYN